MSQQQRTRRRQRQLREQVPAPLLYQGADAVHARPRLPPDVLAELLATACACCNTNVLLHAPAFEHMRIVARDSKRDLVILCESCGEVVRADGPYGELRLIDPRLLARLEQWQTEAN